MEITIRFRPLKKWPKERTPDRDKQNCRFTARYDQTIRLLLTEVDNLGAREIVIEAGFKEADIRNDGLPRSGARIDDNAVAIYIETKKHGPLMFASDTFEGGTVYRPGQGAHHVPGWQNNLRAIALGMEALRKVDRYGITSHGEQYMGWKELGTGIQMGSGKAPMTLEEAAKLLLDAAGMETDEDMVARVITMPDTRIGVFRMASKKMHPDTPEGSDEKFQTVNEANRVLSEHSGE